MNGTPNADMSELKVTLARVDERMVAMQRAAEDRERVADARHAENRASLALYVPRSEIEGAHKVITDRVSSLEAFRGQIVRYALLLAGAVIAGVVAIGKMVGAHLPHLVP